MSAAERWDRGERRPVPQPIPAPQAAPVAVPEMAGANA